MTGAAAGSAGEGGSGDGPVILLSYAHSGAWRVQELLAEGTVLACTAGTGIVPLCAAAAETWRRVEGHDGRVMSRLAVASIRGLITAQVTAILAGVGKTRWCELATSDASAVQPFLDVFPQAVFVCVHRGCLDVIRAGVAASPWGLQGQGLGPYLLSYPGNSVAALAAYWANATDELLAFEDAHSQITRRVRYEDAISDPNEAVAVLRVWLRFDSGPGASFPKRCWPAKPDSMVVTSPEPEVPVAMIPPPLRQRIARLHDRLEYPQLPQ
jgi:hypothetical protein